MSIKSKNMYTMESKTPKVYCAGPFSFQYKDYSIGNLSKDYRSILVGSPDKIAHEPKDECSYPDFKENAAVAYSGPFYFYEDQLGAEDIVRNEMQKIRDADVVFFFLPDNAECPGTVTELINAACCSKEMVIAYIKQDDKDVPENNWNSPLWYPLLFADIKNGTKTTIKRVESKEEAIEVFNNYLKKMNPNDYDD